MDGMGTGSESYRSLAVTQPSHLPLSTHLNASQGISTEYARYLWLPEGTLFQTKERFTKNRVLRKIRISIMSAAVEQEPWGEAIDAVENA